MRATPRFALFLTLTTIAGAALIGCAKEPTTEAPTATGSPAANAPAADDGKIPVTTSSPEAKAAFLAGRDKNEKLLLTDSIQDFQKAAALDPNFALAELNLANTAPTGREFFEHLAKAVSLADQASNGEKLLILATEAGANNNTAKQKDYLDQLVAAYPNDERAHFNLGGYYFAQQDYPQSIEHYKRATEIAPSYSPAYNILGYAYRQAEDFTNAEQAFQKYIALIPGDPNPYDSYGELLLKMGRFDDSITQYRKALQIDPNFVASHQGIACDLMYQGKPDEAMTELQAIATKARNDGEKRLALFDQTILEVDRGNTGKALALVDRQYALGESTKDVPAMAGDLQLKATILLESGKQGAAKKQYERAVKMIADSSLSQEPQGQRQSRRALQPGARGGGRQGPRRGEARSGGVPQGSRGGEQHDPGPPVARDRRHLGARREELRPSARGAPAGEPAEPTESLPHVPGVCRQGQYREGQGGSAPRPPGSTRCRS